MPPPLILLPVLPAVASLLIKVGSSKFAQDCCESGRKRGCELFVDQARNFLHDKMVKQALIETENTTIWTHMADVVQSQLNVIETSIRRLQRSKLHSALTYIQFAKTSLLNNNIENFKKNIEKCEQFAVESISTLDAQDKMTAYTILIMTQFIHESQYGRYPLKGLSAIYGVLNQMRCDSKLVFELNNAIGSKLFFTSNDENLIKSALMFTFEFSKVIKQLTNINKYRNEYQSKKERCTTERKENVCNLFIVCCII